MLTAYRITFEDGNVIETNMAEHITLEDAKKYYLNNLFTFGYEGNEKQVKGVKVEKIN